MATALFAIAAAVLLLGAFGAASWACWLAYGRADPHATLSQRLLAALIGPWILGGACFTVLVSLDAFSPVPAFGTMVLVGVVAHRAWGTGAWASARSIWASAWREVIDEPRARWLGVVAIAVAITMVTRIARGLVMPPVATDTLTYHLLRAARWATSGGWDTELAPDAWGYYEFYPPLGDALWAWALLPGGGDALLPWANAAVWLTLVVATHAAARTLGADRITSIACAFAAGATPAIAVFAMASYVDLAVTSACLAGLVFVARAWAEPTPLAVFAAAGALGFAGGAKPTGLVAVASGAAVLLWVVARAPRRGAAMSAWVAGFALVVPGLVRGWIAHGNPLYPFALRAFGRTILPGNPENDLLQTGALAPPSALDVSLPEFLRALTVPSAWTNVQHLNLGPVWPVWLVLGAVGAWRLRRVSGVRVVVALALLWIAVFVLQLGSDGMRAHRTFSAAAVGRFLTIPLVATIALGAASGVRASFPVAVLAAIVGSALSFPRGLAAVDGPALGGVAIVVAPALAAVWLLRRAAPRWRLAIAGLAIAGVVGRAATLRGELRATYWAALPSADAFDPHPVDPRAAGAWPIWERLRFEPPLRIAFAAGWDGRGHHWYRGPLLGEHLQHEVVYVPPTRDGRVIDYREAEALAAASDLRTWVAGLITAEVDLVVFGAPAPPEVGWLPALGEVFTPWQASADGRSAAYRFDRARASALLGGAPRVQP